MQNLKHVFSIIILIIGLAATAQKTKAPKFGKGLLNLVGQDSTWTMKIGARMQFLTTNDWSIDEGGNYGKSESSMLLRRARLKFGGFAFSPKLKYKIELGLSNKDMGGANEFTNNAPRYVLDAVIKWNFHENFTLWAGQTKLPGNRERVISSGNLQFVDRSRLNKELNIDRDLGFQLRHHYNLSDNFIIREAFAISQGEGRNITKGNLGGHQYTGRIELLPFGNFASKGDYSSSDLKREKTPKLAIGATYNFNDDAVKDKGSQGDYLQILNVVKKRIGFDKADVATIFVDAIFKYNGFSFMGEYAKRDIADRVSSKEQSATNLQTGYLFNSNWEVAGRYTTVKIKNSDFSKNYYTLGLSRYIVGHKLKVQTDVTYQNISGIDTGLGNLQYRLQFDLHF